MKSRDSLQRVREEARLEKSAVKTGVQEGESMLQQGVKVNGSGKQPARDSGSHKGIKTDMVIPDTPRKSKPDKNATR